MPDPFALLPLSLKIFILNGLEDLVSLQAILVGSHSAYRIYNVHYTKPFSYILMHYPSHPLHVVYIMLSIRSRPAQIRAQCSQSMQSFDAFRATTILDNNNTNAGITPLYLQLPLQPRREESRHDCRAGAGGFARVFSDAIGES